MFETFTAVKKNLSELSSTDEELPRPKESPLTFLKCFSLTETPLSQFIFKNPVSPFELHKKAEPRRKKIAKPAPVRTPSSCIFELRKEFRGLFPQLKALG